MKSLGTAIDDFAESQKVPVDTVKGATILVAGYVFGLFYLLIPNTARTTRHIYSIITSCVLFFALFDLYGFLELMAMAWIIYVSTYLGKRNKYVPLVLFVYSLAHLGWKYVPTQILTTTAAKFDHTVVMMIMVIKLTSFAWSVYDGTRPDSELWPEQNELAVYNFPSPVEFFGYVFFFPSFIVGPAFNFRDYQKYINLEAPFNHTPSPFVPTLKSIGVAGIVAFFYVKYVSVYSYERCAELEFLEEPVWKRFLLINLAGFISRTKFYTAWKLAEGACNFSGFGYSGIDSTTNKHIWNRGQNVSILGFEFASNPKEMLDSWNQKTGMWLKNSVYLRLVRPGQGVKPGVGVTAVTFLVSAMWHGFHAGYYFTFLSGAIFTAAGRTLRRNLRPLFITPSKLSPYKPIYDFLGWFLTITMVNYLAGPFMVWTPLKSYRIWASLGFVPLIGMILVVVAFDYLGFGKVVKKFGIVVGAKYESRGSRGSGKNGREEEVMLKDGVKRVESEERLRKRRDSGQGFEEVFDGDLKRKEE
ncbi:lysophospholipid acyltransferase [Blyttiomyces sp. JEL0837]|nr:lysophospholipid acyltransferase [Blyttiomyces sp. JEL0837]